MSIQYIYLGYGTTDENGECKLDHDANGDSISHSYTGTGAGKIDVVASLDSPSSISDSSLVSETYEIIDGTFLDRGTSDSYSDTGWTNSNLNTPFDRTDGTKLEQTNTSSGGVRYRTPSETDNICIEFDFKVVEYSDSVLGFRNGSASVKTVYASNVSAEANTWTHIKITVKDGKYYLNDSPNGTALSEWTRIYLQSYNGNSLKYKNFVIYPI